MLEAFAYPLAANAIILGSPAAAADRLHAIDTGSPVTVRL